jgi:hypothetical protein
LEVSSGNEMVVVAGSIRRGEARNDVVEGTVDGWMERRTKAVFNEVQEGICCG